MAQYKVIQDIEAEDKLLGPLTLKQFIYWAIVAVCLYLTFFTATKGAAFLAVVFLPPAIFFGVLGFPWSKTQPTEVWLLAKIRFFFKPRKRIWDQSGVKELVTITVPKKLERKLTDGLDRTQVRSRLSALAQTVDSRGWAVRQIVNNSQTTADSDRLTAGTTVQGKVLVDEPTIENDVLDEQNNSTAKNIDKMINTAATQRKEHLKSMMSNPQAAESKDQKPADAQQDYWFMNQPDPSTVPSGMTTGQGTTVAPGTQNTPSAAPTAQQASTSKDTEQELLEKLHNRKTVDRGSHEKTILTPAQQQAQAEAAQQEAQQKQQATQAAAAVNKPKPEDVSRLANNNDLDVATIARQANKHDDHPDEVVISLH